MKKFYFSLLLVSLVALWPFFRKGFFESHDGEWMVIRFSAFHQSLTAGQFPVRFVDRLNNNYGYPVMNFLYPLPFYLSEVPKILGFNFIDSIKITFVLTTVLSTVAMYWALSQFFSREASFAASIVYLFIPYRFVDLYVRGSLGENVAFAIAPIVLGCIFKIAKGSKIFLPILSISIGLLIISHNVIAVLFVSLLFLISMILIHKEKLNTIIAFIVGFLISLFFWLPALYDLRFVNLTTIHVSNISDHLVPFSKIIFSGWGYGPLPQDLGGMSVQAGLISIAVYIAGIIFYLRSRKKDPIIGLLLLIYFLAVFMMTKVSLQLWNILPFGNFIQFPWRLLSVVVLISVFLTASVLDTIKHKKAVLILIIVGSVVSTISYTRPLGFVDREEGYYSTNEDTTTVKGEYLPTWVKQAPSVRADEKIVISKGSISNLEIKPNYYRATISSPQDSEVVVNSIYFPGHKVEIDGQNTQIDFQNPNGLITFQLPMGMHEVIIKYNKSPVHLASEIVSLAALIGIGSYLLFLWRKQSF